MNYFERCLHYALFDAIKFHRGVRLGIYRISLKEGYFFVYDTDFLIARISISDGVTIQLYIIAKKWQTEIIISTIEKVTGEKINRIT